jgi:hypothetical protein
MLHHLFAVKVLGLKSLPLDTNLRYDDIQYFFNFHF